MKRKKSGYETIGFNSYLIRQEVLEEQRKSIKDIEEQEIRALQRQELEKKMELLKKREISLIENPSLNLTLLEAAEEPPTLLKWEMFTLDIDSGKATIAGKYHNFDKNKPAYICYLTLLMRRIEDPSDGEVSYQQFTQVTRIEDKDEIRQVIRNLRKNLGINNKKNPNEDVFQATGKGFRLVIPLKY